MVIHRIARTIRKTAEFSEDRVYRYSLSRAWGEPRVLFIGLNPSTADETEDDPTIRRCVNFARAWGYDGMVMANLFAYRATDPKVMLAADDPVGPENDERLRDLHSRCCLTVACWGAGGAHRGRDREVIDMLGYLDIWCLGFTKAGHPRHPLYLRKDTMPVLLPEPSATSDT